MEKRCRHAIHDEGCFDYCKKGHDTLPLNEDGDIECDDYDEYEEPPEDYSPFDTETERELYYGRDLE
jgi:hypothetical protein